MKYYLQQSLAGRAGGYPVHYRRGHGERKRMGCYESYNSSLPRLRVQKQDTHR